MGLLDQYAKFRDYIAANTPRSTRPVAKVGDVLREGLLSPNKFNAPAANGFKDSVFGLLGGIPGAGAPVGFTQGADYFNRGEPVAGAVSIASGVLPFIPTTAAGLFTLAKVADRIGMPLPAGPAKKQAGAIVYHGSPHKFNKFDMSKIGTGEGAQAYGHGLYFAESPAVATDYATKLSSAGLAKNKLAQYGGDIDAAVTAANERIANYKNLIANGGGGDPRRAQGMLNLAEKDLNDLLAMKSGTLNEAGNLYKVDIPDEAVSRMLDWDKPLSEQTPEVQSALQSNPNYEKYWLPHMESAANRKGTNPGGDSLIRYLQDDFDPQEIADLLHSQGIKGIRYLDGSSRGAGQGTSNFVLFDDQLPRILEVNGQPTGLLSWADEAKKAKKK